MGIGRSAGFCTSEEMVFDIEILIRCTIDRRLRRCKDLDNPTLFATLSPEFLFE